MIVNIRATHGSGKTTVVRKLIEHANRVQAIYGPTFGARMPEAHVLRFANITPDVFVLGPYDSDGCGGCDRIQPYKLITPLIERYAARGHVVFEGSLISSCYGTVGALLEQRKHDALAVFLDTPVEECIKRVIARRRERGDDREFDPRQLISKHATIAKLLPKFEAAGIPTTQASSERAAGLIVKTLARK